MNSRWMRAGRAMVLGLVVSVSILPVSGVNAWALPIAEDSSIEVVARSRTTISGVGGSTVRIQVPMDATLDLRSGGSGKSFAGADLEGTGPGFGFVLSDNVPTVDGGKYVYGWQLSDDFGGVDRRIRAGKFDEDENGRFLIPAGAYSLYLVSDGSPVTLTLDLDTVVDSGSTVVTPTRTVPLTFRQLTNLAPGGDAQHNLYSVGQKASFLDGPGFHAIAVATKIPGGTSAGVSGFCYYVGSISNEGTAYLPGCPNEHTDGADAKESPISNPVAGGILIQDFRASSVRSGMYAMGYWRQSSLPLEQMSALGFTLQYDPTFSPGA